MSLERRDLFAVSILNNGGSGYAGISFTGSTPPDTWGAAGPSVYVETVNSSVRIFNPKATGASATTDTLSHFFFTTGGLSGNSLADATGVYVSTIGRFIVADLDIVSSSSDVSALDIAVSKSSNPTTLSTADWVFYHINTQETGYFFDYPGNMGYNADAFVFTCNMFAISTGTSHLQVVSINATDLANGVASPATFHNDLADFSVRPTAMHDAKPGDPMWLVTENGNNTSIDVYKMTNVLSNAASFAKTNLAVTAYSNVVPPLNPNASQVTTNIDGRIMSCGEANNTLVACHAVSVSATQDVAQWYAINVSSGTPVMSQQGRISGGANTYITYPGIDINPSGQIGLSYIQSGTDTPTDYPSMWVAAGTPTSLVSMKVPAGTGQTNLNGGGREGDFSGINVDPVDGSFWAANEFATSASGTNWGTAIANFAANGIVTNANDSGAGSLRQAIIDANNNPGADNITFDSAFFATPRTITLTTGEMLITDAVTINGPGALLAAVSGNSASRIFETNVASGTVTISGLTLTTGKDTSGLGGGAVKVGAGNTVQVNNCAISSNTSNAGGGVFVGSGGSLNILGCTFSGDIASTGNGGGVYFAGTVAAGGLTIRNSTLTGNSAAAGAGGGIAAASLTGTLVVQNCTITGNSAGTGGAIARIGATGSIAIDSSILFSDSAGTGPEISTSGTATVNTSLVQSTSGVSTFTGDSFTNANIGIDPLLGVLQNNGGSTSTRLPNSGSPAIDHGSNPASLTTDQRGSGFPRALGAAVDIGSVEIPGALIVTNINDSGAGSLRQNILDANSIAGANTITFDPTVFNTAKTITLTTAVELLVSESVTITGPAVGVTVSGNNAVRVFDFAGGTTCTLSGITVTKGNTSGKGGGIFAGTGNLNLQGCTITGNTTSGSGGGLYSGGNLTMSYCTVSGNFMTNSANSGGGAYINGTAANSVVITSTTISGNSSASNGGAIQLFGSLTVTITNSTISGNTSSGTAGGGVRAGSGFSGTFNVNNTTVAFNVLTSGTATGSGLSRNGGTFNVFSSIVAKNSGGSTGDMSGSVNVNFSLIGATDGATITGSNNITGTLASQKNPLLAALNNNGGPTLTHLLQAGSPAIDKGSAGALTTDQRGSGFARTVGAAADMGAFEIQPAGSMTAIISGNDLVIADVDGTGKNNVWTTTFNGTNFVISDAVEAFQSAPAGGVLSNGNKTLTIPTSAFSGKLIFNGNGGNDQLTVDNSLGVFTRNVDFNGGNPTSGPGDKLKFTGGTFAAVTHNFSGTSTGNITTGSNTITYTGLEPVDMTGATITDLTLNLPATATNAFLEDDTGAIAGVSQIRSGNSTLETTTFSDPTNSLTINRGNASDSVTINNLPDFNRSLTIGAAGSPFSSVSLNGAVTLAASKNLSAFATSFFVTATGVLSVSGGGAITITADDADINASGTVSAGPGVVAIAPVTASRAIDVGTNTVGSLGLTNAELGRVTAGTLKIGDTNSGALTVSADITRSNPTAMQLTSASDVVISGGQVNTGGGTLLLHPGTTPAAVKPTHASTDATASTVSFASDLDINIAGTTLDTQYDQLNVAGTVDLTGVNLILSGVYAPVTGNSFTIVSANTVTNKFNGLNEGAIVSLNGKYLAVHYTATSVVLTAVSAPIVSNLQIDDGSGQRSMIRSLTVTFSDAVTFSGALTSAITLFRNTAPNEQAGITGLVNLIAVQGPGNTVTLHFADTGANPVFGVTSVNSSGKGFSLPDGRYTLTIDASQVTDSSSGLNLDGDFNSTAGGNYVLASAPGPATPTNIFRLYGDINGDGAVGTNDFTFFRGAFNGMNEYLDYNDDGFVATNDFAQFKNRFQQTFP
jgi:hypothetical protein